MLQRVYIRSLVQRNKKKIWEERERDREKRFNNRIFHFLHFKEQPTKLPVFPFYFYYVLYLCILLLPCLHSSYLYHHYFMSILYFFIVNCLSNAADVCSTTIHICFNFLFVFFMYSSLSIYINFFH